MGKQVLDGLGLVFRAAILARNRVLAGNEIEGPAAAGTRIANRFFSHRNTPFTARSAYRPGHTLSLSSKTSPHSVQNLPLLTAPHEQVQPSSATGFGWPQFMQNLPVLPIWPQLQVQPVSCGFGSGLG